MTAPVRAALVTGASSGIGAATARTLALGGASVVLVARRPGALEEVARGIRRDGGTVFTIESDLLTDGAATHVVERATALVGELDALVCSAGMARLSNIHDCDTRSWDRQIRLNLTAPFELARAVLPAMRKRRRGWIVNISSGVALEAVPGSGAYGVSKSALNKLTEILHQENRDHGVHVHAVCPGWVRTDLAATPEDQGVDPDVILTPEDVADTVSWLLSRPGRVSVGPVVRVEPLAAAADAARAMTSWIDHARASGALR